MDDLENLSPDFWSTVDELTTETSALTDTAIPPDCTETVQHTNRVQSINIKSTSESNNPNDDTDLDDVGDEFWANVDKLVDVKHGEHVDTVASQITGNQNRNIAPKDYKQTPPFRSIDTVSSSTGDTNISSDIKIIAKVEPSINDQPILTSLNRHSDHKGTHAEDVKISESLPETTSPDKDVYPFGFPFPPYDIQRQLMDALYRALKEGRSGIFESPTGTGQFCLGDGKSLSLVCGSLSWYLEHVADIEEKSLQLLQSSDNCGEKASSSGLDWLDVDYDKNKRLAEEKTDAAAFVEMITKRRERLREAKEALRSGTLLDFSFTDIRSRNEPTESHPSVSDLSAKYADEWDEFAPDDNPITSTPDIQDERLKEPPPARTKIFYCSRTHSQLAQFFAELCKTKYKTRVSVVTLGSRQTLCINPDVRKLGSANAMNDRCLEMQKNTKSNADKEDLDKSPKAKRRKKASAGSSCKCRFYKAEGMQRLADAILVEPKDIEDLVTQSKELAVCPYYASRYAASDSDVVLLPYNTLFHESTRNATGLDLRDSILIVDEAHNLLETIRSINGASLSLAQLTTCQNQLRSYMEKYKNRLKSENLLYIRQLDQLVTNLHRYLSAHKGKPDVAFRVQAFLSAAKIDAINTFELSAYLERSQLTQKLRGFTTAAQSSQSTVDANSDVSSATRDSGFLTFLKKEEPSDAVPTDGPGATAPNPMSSPYMSPLTFVDSFIKCLNWKNKDGRVMVVGGDVKHAPGGPPLAFNPQLKFLLLNPANEVGTVMKETRSVILAGGTMEPVDEFEDHLFAPAGIPSSSLVKFSCDHVVSKDNVFPLVITKTLDCTADLDFSFSNRDNTTLISKTGELLAEVVKSTPGGVVCFLPSYDFETMLYDSWQKHGQLDVIQRSKLVFREPKSAAESEAVLNKFGETIERSRKRQGASVGISGSMLLAVVGGKLSEGINFNDALCRAVVMIGMPYPNIKSLELQEKMKYLDACERLQKSSEPTWPKTTQLSAGRKFYENACMKAVNQSIGRAIRHQNDYAAILLLDARYKKPSVIKQLPKWIRTQLSVQDKFDTASYRMFFASK